MSSRTGSAPLGVERVTVTVPSPAATDLTGTNSLGYSGSYEAWDYSTTNLIYLGFNTQRGPFRSAQLRRALSRGIDRRSIAEISFAHHAVPTALPIHPDSPLYHQLLSDSADYSPDDLVKARSWLVRKNWSMVPGSR